MSTNNTQTYLIEANRSGSEIDKTTDTRYNGKWTTRTDFTIKRGDKVSVEAVMVESAGAGKQVPVIEFTGENVVIGNEQKAYADNRVMLELCFYINNNGEYSCQLPLQMPYNFNDEQPKEGVPAAPDYLGRSGLDLPINDNAYLDTPPTAEDPNLQGSLRYFYPFNGRGFHPTASFSVYSIWLARDEPIPGPTALGFVIREVLVDNLLAPTSYYTATGQADDPYWIICGMTIANNADTGYIDPAESIGADDPTVYGLHNFPFGDNMAVNWNCFDATLPNPPHEWDFYVGRIGLPFDIEEEKWWYLMTNWTTTGRFPYELSLIHI